MPSIPFFFFNDTATTEIYTLSLHDALPIYISHIPSVHFGRLSGPPAAPAHNAGHGHADRKSTRLNSSHVAISYAVFCLKKKKTKIKQSKKTLKTRKSHKPQNKQCVQRLPTT